MSDEKNTAFSYTYSPKERAEVKRIREKYTKEETSESKLEKIKRLDRKATEKSTTVSLILGTVGALALGLGLSSIMTDFALALGSLRFVLGILIGLVGISLIAAAYPVYLFITKKERERVAPEILRLSDELLK